MLKSDLITDIRYYQCLLVPVNRIIKVVETVPKIFRGAKGVQDLEAPNAGMTGFVLAVVQGKMKVIYRWLLLIKSAGMVVHHFPNQVGGILIDGGLTVAAIYAELAVDPDGVVLMPAAHLPFFSTKDTGTGLGLAMTHKIIEEHNGDIDVVSTPGAGTTFSLRLPCIQD